MVVGDKYRLVAPIGRGGMGTVWRADHLALRSPVAVKLMHQRIASDPAAAERFSREARAAAAIRSPHVVGVLDFGIHDGSPYVVMELLEGESLDQRLARVGRLDANETARIVTHAARALAKAHEQGVVHRDLKPANVFLVRDPHGEIVKLLDFGVAKLSPIEGVSPLTSTGAVIGTPHYMSPEQARGRREVDHRTDLWALGIIAFECLTGKRPFESEVLGDLLLKICTDPVPPPSSLAAVPPGFDQWFARAIEREPEQRFQSALELSDALRAIVGQPVAAPPSAPAASVATLPPARTHRGSGASIALLLGAGVLALGLLVALAAGGLALWSFYGARATAPSAAPAASPSTASVEPHSEPIPSAPGETPPLTAPTAKPKSSAVATATPTGTATPTATATAAGGTSACTQACNKIRACAPGTKCEDSPCSGWRRALADCVNRTPCAKLEDCLP